jgi:rubrerythrin
MTDDQVRRRAIPLSPLEQPPDTGARRLERAEGAGGHFPRVELRCAKCGHSAITTKPIQCPACGGDGWDFVAWRPLGR